jgi:hypothetical protein
MESNPKLLLDLQDFIPKGKNRSLVDLCIKFSQETSLQPVPEFLPYFYARESWFKKPRGCLQIILACSLTRPGWSCAELYEKLLERIYHQARIHNFQGEWELVGEVLQQDLFTQGVNGILCRLVKNLSKEDFFGNFLPGTYRCIEVGLFVKNNWTTPVAFLSKRDRCKGIKRKIRRRGYNDKGSRKPSHEYHGIPKFILSESEYEEYKKRLQKLAPPKSPPSQYYYRTLNYGDGPNGAQLQNNLI